ncbi:hypothetical protein, partial [uncultured Roseovarius sp.]|uniref:hypothetical protein n=1 Tax=uncultured Roseovarius sp. TaxID=293344 RepID=UPI00260A03CF
MFMTDTTATDDGGESCAAALATLDFLRRHGAGAFIAGIRHIRCLIPWFDGAILSQEWKEALWAKFVTGAPRPRTLSEQRYSDRK